VIDVVEELNDAARLQDQSAADPILITTSGTILAGFGRWRLALLEGRQEVRCIEYPINEEESLQFILNHHKPRRGWNAFVRIRLALTLEPDLQQRALDNMRAGGKFKGLANLPEAQLLDVRQQIADIAGVGTRNVSKVKTIRKNAHPRLITALLNGTLTINGAMQFCNLPKAEQLEHFIRHSEERETNKVIRRSIIRSRKEKISPDVGAVLDALQQQEARQPGSVVVQVGRFQRTVVLIGQELLTGPYSQKELDLNEIPRSSQADPLSDAPTLGPG
jgi:ParB-like chromosome segregation protein Spo0J